MREQGKTFAGEYTWPKPKAEPKRKPAKKRAPKKKITYRVYVAGTHYEVEGDKAYHGRLLKDGFHQDLSWYPPHAITRIDTLEEK